MIKQAVLFDWTGTLSYQDRFASVDPFAALCTALQADGIAVDTERLSASFRAVFAQYNESISLAELIAEACARVNVPLGPSQLDRLTLVAGEAIMAGQEIYDDARAMLASLKYRGYLLAIVSNLILPAPMLRKHLKNVGVAGYFDVLVTSADVGKAKPHPAPFLRAVEALRVLPREAVVVGDSLDTDIAGAQAAGLDAIFLDRYRRNPGAPVTRIERLTGLATVLGEGHAPGRAAES